MGKIKQGILGGFSGKVGNVIGTSWKGISVVKVMPQSVANPKTTAQVAQRSKLANTVAFATMILSDFIKPVWDRFAQGMSGYNDFISTNISLFQNPEPSDYSALITSKGKLDKFDSLTGVIQNHNTLVLDWDDGVLGTYGQDTDQLCLLVINQANSEVLTAIFPGVTRHSPGTNIGILGVNPVAGDKISVYVNARRADGTMVSNCQYLELTA